MSQINYSIFTLPKSVLSNPCPLTCILPFYGFPSSSVGKKKKKNPPAMQETQVQSLGREDSPVEGNGYPLQYSSLENPMDIGI